MLYAFAAVAMMSAPLWPANSSALAAAHTLPAVAASTEVLGIVVARNGRPLRLAPTECPRRLMKLAGWVVRSTPLLALTLKLRALTRRLVPATV